jgi:hypothetical protein
MMVNVAPLFFSAPTVREQFDGRGTYTDGSHQRWRLPRPAMVTVREMSDILKQKTSETVSQNSVDYSSSSTKQLREPMLCGKVELVLRLL